MRMRYVDVAALRRHAASPAQTEASKPDPLVISRRAFVGVTAAAPFAAFGDHERVRFVNEGAHAIFLLDGRPAWIIDPDAFSGSPHLSVRESANDIEIEMRGGRFPGSRIPADFRALCTRRGKRWSMRVTPYCSRVESALTTGTSSTSAWAMRSRSKGSRWWLGSSACLAAYSTVMGRSDACRPASAWFIHCRYGIDRESFAIPSLIAISPTVAALTSSSLAGSAIAACDAMLRRLSWSTHQITAWESSRTLIPCSP